VVTGKNVKLFTGCIIQNRLPFLEKSARIVLEKLGVNLQDEQFTCCPDPVGVAAISKKAWLTLGARNLALGEKDKTDILSLCNGCTESLQMVKHILQKDKGSLKEINKILGTKWYKYKKKAQVIHFVKLLVKDIGITKIKGIVEETWRNRSDKRNPIEGLKVASHPGCHYNKPSEILKWDDPDDPKFLDQLIQAIGGIPVKYEEKTLCCGSAVYRTREDLGIEISRRKYQSIKKAGAQAIAVNCPSCYQTLESNQRKVNLKFEEEYMIPVFYITELMALAFGHTPEEIGLKFHTVGKNLFE